jgi:hypothetical protein
MRRHEITEISGNGSKDSSLASPVTLACPPGTAVYSSTPYFGSGQLGAPWARPTRTGPALEIGLETVRPRGQVGRVTARMTRWRDGDTRQRCCAAGLLRAEAKFRRARGRGDTPASLKALECLMLRTYKLEAGATWHNKGSGLRHTFQLLARHSPLRNRQQTSSGDGYAEVKSKALRIE